jgi:hypothetical protein
MVSVATRRTTELTRFLSVMASSQDNSTPDRGVVKMNPQPGRGLEGAVCVRSTRGSFDSQRASVLA